MVSKEILEEFEPQPIPIKLLRKCKFHYSDEYQRSDAWRPGQKQKLIDSIIHNYPIGLFVFIKRGEKKFEVIDGQQRLKAINEFIKPGGYNTAKTDSIIKNKSYSDIKKDAKYRKYLNKFDVYNIWYIPIPDHVKDEQVCDIFIRMQEGTPTNTPEKLNAMKGDMRNLIYKLSQKNKRDRYYLNFFNKIKIINYRFRYREILAHLALLEVQFISKSQLLHFPNIRLNSLKEMYSNYKDSLPPNLEKNIRKTFNFIDRCSNDAKFITNNGDFAQLYLISSILSRKYSLNKNLRKVFVTEIQDFFADAAIMSKKIGEFHPGEIRQDPIKHYASLRSAGQTRDNLKTKFLIITDHIFEKMKNVQPLFEKDEKRYFDICQKIYVYYKKDKGKCQKSGCKNKNVKWGEASFHHKRFHSDGGPTTIDNCQLMHRDCHNKIHERRKDETELIN